jgi:hypothetical protein
MAAATGSALLCPCHLPHHLLLLLLLLLLLERKVRRGVVSRGLPGHLLPDRPVTRPVSPQAGP